MYKDNLSKLVTIGKSCGEGALPLNTLLVNDLFIKKK